MGPQHVLRIKARAGRWPHGHVRPITSGPRDSRMFTALLECIWLQKIFATKSPINIT